MNVAQLPKAWRDLGADYIDQTEEFVDLCIAIQQIEAPTGAEALRAEVVHEQLVRRGLTDVHIDSLANVYARLPAGPAAAQGAPALLISAHTDTVFPAGTDLTIRRDRSNDRIFGPGIGDNSAGVAGLLTVATALREAGGLPVDVWFAANVCEEGLGDLRGMRAVMDSLSGRIGAAIVLEGMGVGRIVHRALGSRRYRIRATAPGGHSWSDFGTPSAIHALVQLARDLVRMKPPSEARTTFNIGKISGGTSVNTIAQSAELELDLRSEEAATLAQIDQEVERIVSRYQRPEWRRRGVEIDSEVIGDRPGGDIAATHPLVRAAQDALAVAGLTVHSDVSISSTDANVPLSRGIPAVCVGITDGGDAHRLEEWMGTRKIGAGLQHLVLLCAWAGHWLAQAD